MGMRRVIHPKDPLDNLHKLDEKLRADVTHWAEYIKNGSSGQIGRRAFVRAAFSFIEGIVFGMKQFALELAETRKVSFDAGEISFIREEASALTHSGEIQTKPTKITLETNLRFAFRVFAKGGGATYVLDVSGADWQRLRRSIAIRDRLMHPKLVEDVDVSNEEFKDVMFSSTWFAEAFEQLFKETLEIYKLERKA